MPSERHYPPRLTVEPLAKLPKAAVTVPGSKSITNRALVMAAITAFDRQCELYGALQSEDTEVMIDSLGKLGYLVRADWEAEWPVVCVGPYPRLQEPCPPFPNDVYVENSGTTMRFLTALVTLGRGRFRIDGNKRMRQRPVQDLLDALQQVGVKAISEHGNGCPPIVIEADRYWKKNHLRVRGDTSSQFLSALLMVAPIAMTASFDDPNAEWECVIEVDGPLVSEPYVQMTIGVMEHWGFIVEREGLRFRALHPGAHGTAQDQKGYVIEPDASAASYFFATAAITGGTITVDMPRNSLQGDIAFLDVLEQMGCRVEECESGITVHGRALRGVDVDMNAISDTVMTLGAVACFAEGPTTIRNVAHIRHKETDRIAALAAELRKVGAEVEEFADGLRITPRPLHGAEIETYDDHRMAMSMALIGLKVPGITILNPGCVAKTYPGFWEDLERLRS